MHLTHLPFQNLQGFFVPYLTGAIVLVVLAVGSTAPGLLQIVIGRFAQVFPDYRERVLRHEAAHFLVRLLAQLHITLCCKFWCLTFAHPGNSRKHDYLGGRRDT